MTALEDQHSLWTYDENPAWTDSHCGISDRLLMLGLSRESAITGANHLADIYRGDTFEVRDVDNTAVHSAQESAPRVSAGPARRRRTLGKGVQ